MTRNRNRILRLLGLAARGALEPLVAAGRRRGRVGGCGRIHSRPDCGIVRRRHNIPQGVVELDMQPQLLREVGKSLAVLVEGRGLAQLASRQEFAKDQVDTQCRPGWKEPSSK